MKYEKPEVKIRDILLQDVITASGDDTLEQEDSNQEGHFGGLV